jgi:predicted phosphoribosyltransferase
MLFQDRRQAGVMLGEVLADNAYPNPHIFAMPRGGVPVGYEVAKVLRAPLDLVVVRKLGAPSFPEYGFGAIAPSGVLVVDESAVSIIGLDHEQIEAVKSQELRELNRRLKEYRAGGRFDLKDETAILVDDGVATGTSALAGLRFLEGFNPKKLILAVPICAPDSLRVLRKEVDEVICLDAPLGFTAVGQFYQDFEQTSDTEVRELLQKAKKWV